jgi:DnaA-homolog protein
MAEQLPLSFKFAKPQSFENFFVATNRELVKALKSLVTHEQPQMLFMWGLPGAGKTHLCQSLCQLADEHQQSIAYLPLTEQGIAPPMLEGIENMPLVILDDVDKVTGDNAWDESIFHLYNRIKANDGKLLMTSSSAPNSLSALLPDLQSRFSWGLVYQLEALDDADKIQALINRANELGLSLPFEVGQFLINRLPRDTHQLFATLETLDKQSLSHQRPLTVPFVKQVLEL